MYKNQCANCIYHMNGKPDMSPHSYVLVLHLCPSGHLSRGFGYTLFSTRRTDDSFKVLNRQVAPMPSYQPTEL